MIVFFIPGGKIVERTVLVNFVYNSGRPDEKQTILLAFQVRSNLEDEK